MEIKIKMDYFKKFLLIIFLFNLFGIILGQDCFDEVNDNCITLLLYYNGTGIRNSENRANINLKEETLSIATFDKIILHDCMNENNSCSYRNTTIPNNLDDCKNRKKDKNNFCCFLKEECYDPKSNNITSHSSCIQVDKNEYQRFKIHNNSTNNPNNITNYFGRLECFDRFYIKGMNKFLIFLILFFLF